jgi:hypothetical protein
LLGNDYMVLRGNAVVEPLEAVGIKPAQAEIRRSREGIQETRNYRLETRDQSKNQKKCNEKFVIKEDFNVWTVVRILIVNRDVQ